MGRGVSLRSAWSVGAMWTVALPLMIVSAVRWEKWASALTRPPASGGGRADSDSTDTISSSLYSYMPNHFRKLFSVNFFSNYLFYIHLYPHCESSVCIYATHSVLIFH